MLAAREGAVRHPPRHGSTCSTVGCRSYGHGAWMVKGERHEGDRNAEVAKRGEEDVPACFIQEMWTTKGMKKVQLGRGLSESRETWAVQTV